MKKRVQHTWLVLCVLSIAVGATVFAFLFRSPAADPQPGSSTSGVPRSSSESRTGPSQFVSNIRDHIAGLQKRSSYENVAETVASAGSSECATCHDSIVESYFETGMGRSLGLMQSRATLPDAVIDDIFSPRKYRVVHRDGVMWHQEWLSAKSTSSNEATSRIASDDILVSEYPVKWQIGSGNHARSYLLKIDGYLTESPVTWYTSRKAWGMSPGFDHAGHSGFARVAEAGCLYCHAGDASPMDGSSHQLTIHEAAIGCERCHGPGQLHVDRRTAALNDLTDSEPQTLSDIDTTIINPRHLDRELSDSICGQCHLRSAATAFAPGVRLDDYRPGLNLADFRTDYRLDRSNSSASTTIGPPSDVSPDDNAMTVVGHIEQLQKSRCYQMSELSCVTCHDPHRHISPAERIEHYRSVCWQCHDQDDCYVADDELQKRSPNNDCTTCHMPRSGTDIPHLTFTHHRIGLHADFRSGHEKAPAKSANLPPGKLVPLTESGSIPQSVKDAMLGVAYLELSGRNDGLSHAQLYQEHAFNMLIEAWQREERSPEVASALAALGTDRRLPSFAEFVRTAAGQPDITASMRVNFLLSQAFWNADQKHFLEAADFMKEVVTIRRAPTDWQLLGDFNRAAGRTQQTAEAFEKVLKISPLNTTPRRWLVEYYDHTNNHDSAEQHRKVLSLMSSWQQEHGQKQ